MIKETIKYPRFSETDFIRLYCAINFQKGLSPIIKHHELETKLYEFYSLPDFEELFQDICPKKDYINPKKFIFRFRRCNKYRTNIWLINTNTWCWRN